MSREHAAILLIEDNPGDARLLREMLPEGRGVVHSLEWVDSLEAGLRRIAQGGIDLVLLDLGLPESTGLDTLRHLRGEAAHLPTVVVMSSLGDEAIAVQALLEGAQDYLVKGQVDGSGLIRSIRYAIERNEAAVALRQARDELENQVLERTTTLAHAMESLESEIAERKRAEAALHRLNRELRAISNCNQILMRAVDEQTLLNDICRIVCDEAGYRMAWVGFAEHDKAKTVRPVAWAGVEDGYLAGAHITWADTERGRGPGGTAIRNGETVCIQDFAQDPTIALWRESASQRGYRSCIVLPLKGDHAITFGALAIYASQPNVFNPDEIRLLEELAGDLAFGIAVLRGRIERQQAQEKLAHLASIVESSDDAIIGKSLDETIVSWNRGAERIYGYTAGEIVGRSISILIPADLKTELATIVERLKGGEGFEHLETTRLCKGGQIIHVALTISPIKNACGQIVGASTIARDITDRKQTEHHLTLVNFALNHVSEAAYLMDDQGRFAYLNEGACRMLGYSPEELLQLNLFALDPDLPRDRWQELKAGNSLVFESHHRAKDGRLIPVEINANVFEYDGQAYNLALVRNITERKRVDDALLFVAQRGWQSGAENFFDALAQFLGEKLAMDYVLIDRIDENPDMAETVALYAKGAITPNMRYALKGTPCENVMGRRLCVYRQGIQQLFPEDPLLPGMGAESYIGIPLWDSTGQPIGLIAAMGTEPLADDAPVTQLLQLVATRAAAELERKRGEEQLRLQSSALAAAANAIVITDRDGKIKWVNPAFTRSTGYAADEVIDRTPAILNSGTQAREFYEQMWQTILAGKVWHGELVNRSKDGRLFTDDMTITPVRGADGQIAHFVAIKQDVTERRLLEDQLRQAQKMEAIGTLAGGIAHDFNNILGVMEGYGVLLQQDTEGNAAAQEDIEEILKAATRAKELVQQILTFSRQLDQKRQPIPLNAVVKEATKFLRASLSAEIKIEVEVASNAPAVLADATQIYQIVINLATNALHAMEGRPGRLTVGLDSFQPDEPFIQSRPEFRPIQYARLTVADTGQGMDAKSLERIYEPFFTTKPVGKGTGLGLSVVHGIVQSHQGIITVESKVGQGTTFRLYFPALTTDTALTDVTIRTIARGRSEKILLVDDEPALTASLQRLLERLDYRVTSCNNAGEAVRLFRENPTQFDLVITDLAMPDMSGLEVARQLRSLRPDVPVILATGFAPELDREKLLAAGIGQLLEKPISLSALAAVLNRTLVKPKIQAES